MEQLQGADSDRSPSQTCSTMIWLSSACDLEANSPVRLPVGQRDLVQGAQSVVDVGVEEGQDWVLAA